MSDKPIDNYLKRHSITKYAIKVTGLNFDELLSFRVIPNEDHPNAPHLWSLSCPVGLGDRIKNNKYLDAVHNFALLNWLSKLETIKDYEMINHVSIHLDRVQVFIAEIKDNEALERSIKGAEQTAKRNKNNALDNAKRAYEIWRKLDSKVGREKAGIVANQMGMTPETIRNYRKKYFPLFEKEKRKGA